MDNPFQDMKKALFRMRLRLLLLGVAVLVAVAGLLYVNQRDVARAASANEASDTAMRVMHAMHDMRFGVSRVVSSMNEMLVLGMLNPGEEVEEIEHEKVLVGNGRRQVEASLKILNGQAADTSYAEALGQATRHYQALLVLAGRIENGTAATFQPQAVKALKEQIEQEEMAVLARIETMMGIWQGTISGTQEEGRHAIRNMERETLILALFLVLGLVAFMAYLYSLLFREQAAHSRLAQLARENEREAGRRLQLEKALSHSRKLEFLGTFASGMAHELNNKILPIITMAESMRGGLAPGDPNLRKLDIILKGADGAKGTLEKILGFARKDGVLPGYCRGTAVWKAAGRRWNNCCGCCVRAMCGWILSARTCTGKWRSLWMSCKASSSTCSTMPSMPCRAMPVRSRSRPSRSGWSRTMWRGCRKGTICGWPCGTADRG